MEEKKLHRYVCARLVEIRESKNITQKQVEWRLKIPQSSLSKYENGERTISISILYKLSLFYNVPISEFFPPYIAKI